MFEYKCPSCNIVINTPVKPFLVKDLAGFVFSCPSCNARGLAFFAIEPAKTIYFTEPIPERNPKP